jgi:hypothetical protein
MTVPARTCRSGPERMFRVASGHLAWLRGLDYSEFLCHARRESAFALLWPLRLEWSFWWMNEAGPDPRTRDELRRVLKMRPPSPREWPVADPVDWPVATLVDAATEPAHGPVLAPGTTLSAGHLHPDYSEGLDHQRIAVTSGPWAGTPACLRVGQVGARDLIAFVGVAPIEERLHRDPARANRLLDDLRAISQASAADETPVLLPPP